MVPSSAALSARRLHKTLSPLIGAATQESRADRYRKHFPAFAHVWMLVLHVMSGNLSLRQSYSQQSADPRLRTRLGMPQEGVSYSQLARSSSSRSPECFEHLLAALVRRARTRPEPEHTFKLLRKVQVLDSTFFSLSAKASPWSVHGEHEPGVRLQAGLELARMIPTTLKLTLPDTNDATALKEWDLCGLEGWTFVFDLGYYAHFRRLLEAGLNFVTRLKAQSSYEVTESKALPEQKGATMTTPEGDEILSDEIITLGSPKNSRGAVLKGMRPLNSKRIGKGRYTRS